MAASRPFIETRNNESNHAPQMEMKFCKQVRMEAPKGISPDYLFRYAGLTSEHP